MSRGVEDPHLVVHGARVGGQLLPTLDRRVEILRGELAAPQVVERRLVRARSARPAPGLDRHVADGHPLFHAQRPDRLPVYSST